MTLSEKIEYFEKYLDALTKLCRSTTGFSIRAFKGSKLNEQQKQDRMLPVPHRNKIIREMYRVEQYILWLKGQQYCNKSQYKFKRA